MGESSTDCDGVVVGHEVIDGSVEAVKMTDTAASSTEEVARLTGRRLVR